MRARPSKRNAMQLIRDLHDQGFFDDLPEDQQAFRLEVLGVLPFMGNPG